MTTRFISGLILSLFCLSANAALHARLSGQAYYDDVLNITWLANANLADTNAFGVGGINNNGSLTWATANAWIAAMNASSGGAGYLGVNNWRLPKVTDTGTPGCNESFNGTDCGYNVDISTGEMARMYYSTLGNSAAFDTSGNVTGCSLQPSPYCLSNDGPFSNLRPGPYWYGTEMSGNSASAWYLGFDNGAQAGSTKTSDYFYAWAVRDGDIAPPQRTTWTLQNVTFNDGGTASGSFVYDTANELVSDVSVTTSGGAFGETYDEDYDGFFGSITAANLVGLGSSSGGLTPELGLALSSPMTNAGGTIPIQIDNNLSGEYDSTGTLPRRYIQSGQIRTVVTYRFTGQITAIGSGMPGPYGIGEPVSGTLVVKSAGTDTCGTPAGCYTGAVTSYRATIGGITGSSVDLNNQALVLNDTADEVYLIGYFFCDFAGPCTSQLNQFPGFSGANPTYLDLYLSDSSGSALSSAVIPDLAYLFSRADTASGSLGAGSTSFCSSDCSYTFAITSVTRIIDVDSDAVADVDDNCPANANADQLNSDGDGRGNACDNCTLVANPTQLDTNGDGYGNICDADLNNDGHVTAAGDYVRMRSVLGQPSTFSALAADSDMNGDGTVTAAGDYVRLRARLVTDLVGPSGLCAATPVMPCTPP